MANGTTLSTLMARALDFANMTGVKAAKDGALIDYVNAGLSELHDMLVQASPEWFLSKKSYTITEGQEEYALPSDFYKEIKLWFSGGTAEDRRYKIEKFMLDHIDGYKIGPLTNGTAEMWYAPMFTRLKDPDDKIMDLIPIGWEDYAAYHAAAQLLSREESDSSVIRQNKAELGNRILVMSAPRDMGEPDVIQDSSNRWSPLVRSLWAYEYRYKYRILGNNVHFIDVRFQGI
jgi:hypothetical protein